MIKDVRHKTLLRSRKFNKLDFTKPETMKSKVSSLLLLCILILVSCERNNDPDISSPVSLTGHVQKGPFLNGTSILINELHEDLSQSGKIYTAQISDKAGDFQISNMKLSSKYVSLRADGFYFNEITGENSEAQLTLYALSNIADRSSVNINTLSHLEKNRVEWLVDQGMDFTEAKAQSQSEILDIFCMGSEGNRDSESLDISSEGEDNAKLLAISAIFQGFRSAGDLSELMAEFITDIREDGKLDDSSIGSELMTYAGIINLQSIRTNLEKYYNDSRKSAAIPPFEKYVKQFIDSSRFEAVPVITYPKTGEFGRNVLSLDEDTMYVSPYSVNWTAQSMAVHLDRNMKVQIKLSGGNWSYRSLPEPENWTVSAYSGRRQTFTSTDPGKDCDLQILFELFPDHKTDTIRVDYYENYFDVQPVRSKTIIVR